MLFVEKIKNYVNDKRTNEYDWDAVRAKIKAENFINGDVTVQRKQVLKDIRQTANKGKFRLFAPILYPENEEYLKSKGYSVESTDNMSIIKWE